MNGLDYSVLVEAYEMAVKLELEDDFIELLREEIQNREQLNRKRTFMVVKN